MCRTRSRLHTAVSHVQLFNVSEIILLIPKNNSDDVVWMGSKGARRGGGRARVGLFHYVDAFFLLMWAFFTM